jgi:site-specific DNA recombinase
MKVVCYSRVSSAIQAEKGTIRTQDEVADRYCAANGITLTNRYVDDGVSGSIPIRERPGGAKLWADADARRFDLILVFSLSRLARSTLEILNALEFFKSKGIAIKSLTQDIDTSTPTGQFFITNLASMDQLMRDNIKENTRHGLERIVRAGQWAGGKPPFGYSVIDKRLTIDPIQSEIVKDIFSWYLGGLRVRGIAIRLNSLEIKHPLDWKKEKSRIWWDTTVSKLLRNRVYVGEWVWRKRTDRRKVGGRSVCTKTTSDQQIAIAVPPIIANEDFEQIQQTLTTNRANSFRNVKNFYLLRSLIFCRECGSKYVGMTSGRKPWVKQFYRCRSHISTSQLQPCKGKAVRADLLDAAVWDHCSSFAEDPSLVIDELRSVMLSKQDNQWELRLEAKALDASIAARSQQRAKVINLHRKGIVSDDEAERELLALRSELEGMEQQLLGLRAALGSAEDAEYRIVTAESMLNLVAERVLSADDKTKREVALAWIDRIEIETVGEGRKARGIAHVRFVFQPSSEAVDYVEGGVATSRARFAACWPRTSRKSTL